MFHAGGCSVIMENAHNKRIVYHNVSRLSSGHLTGHEDHDLIEYDNKEADIKAANVKINQRNNIANHLS